MTESRPRSARQHRPASVLISVTGAGHENAVTEAVAALRAGIDVPILLGGAAVASEEVAPRLGSDQWTGLDARQVVLCGGATGQPDPALSRPVYSYPGCGSCSQEERWPPLWLGHHDLDITHVWTLDERLASH
jgi:hypothetical protein